MFLFISFFAYLPTPFSDFYLFPLWYLQCFVSIISKLGILPSHDTWSHSRLFSLTQCFSHHQHHHPQLFCFFKPTRNPRWHQFKNGYSLPSFLPFFLFKISKSVFELGVTGMYIFRCRLGVGNAMTPIPLQTPSTLTWKKNLRHAISGVNFIQAW